MITEKQLQSTQKVLKAIEELAEKDFLPIIGSFKGKYLAEEVRKAKPTRILEVGTLIGYSTILMGKELGSDAEIVTIEIHPDEAKQAGENILNASMPPKVKIITGDAMTIIPTLEGKFDFAFIDAEKTEYLKYLQLAEPKFHRCTVVFADNAGIFADQMGDYLDYVRCSGNYRSRYIQVGDDGVEISVKL